MCKTRDLDLFHKMASRMFGRFAGRRYMSGGGHGAQSLEQGMGKYHRLPPLVPSKDTTGGAVMGGREKDIAVEGKHAYFHVSATMKTRNKPPQTHMRTPPKHSPLILCEICSFSDFFFSPFFFFLLTLFSSFVGSGFEEVEAFDCGRFWHCCAQILHRYGDGRPSPS